MPEPLFLGASYLLTVGNAEPRATTSLSVTLGTTGPPDPSGRDTARIALLRWYPVIDGLQFPVGNLPSGLAFDGAHIWLATQNGVTKLRACDGSILGNFAAGNGPNWLAFNGANIWVTNQNDNSVTKLRASDGSVAGNFAVGLDPSAGIAFDGADIWVVGHDNGAVAKLRAIDGSILGTFTVGPRPMGIAFDGPISGWGTP